MRVKRFLSSLIRSKLAVGTALFFIACSFLCYFFYQGLESEYNRTLFRFFYAFSTLTFVGIEVLALGRKSSLKSNKSVYNIFRLIVGFFIAVALSIVLSLTMIVREQVVMLFRQVGTALIRKLTDMMLAWTYYYHGTQAFLRSDVYGDIYTFFYHGTNLAELIRLLSMVFFSLIGTIAAVRLAGESRSYVFRLGDGFLSAESLTPVPEEKVTYRRLAVGFVYKTIP